MNDVAIFNFEPIMRTTTLLPYQLTIIDSGAPLNLTNATICMQLKRQANSSVIFEFPITIVDALNGVIRLDEFIVDFPAYTYQYDLKITTNGQTFPYMKGTFTVVQNISECQ